MTLRIEILLLLLLLTWNIQAKTRSKKEDSLWSIVHSPKQSKDAIANAYFELFKINANATFSDNGRQVEYNLNTFQKAASFFKTLPATKQKLRYELIRYVIDENNLTKVEQVKRCNDNLKLAKTLNEIPAIIDILQLKSKIFCENDLPESGINYLKESLFYQKILEYNPERIAYCYFMIGWRTYNSKIFEQSSSIIWFQNAYEVIKNLEGELYSKCEYSGWLSNAYTSEGDFENALKYRNIALAYAKQFPEDSDTRDRMVFDSYRYLGQIYLIQKDYRKAIETLEYALPISYSIDPDYTIWVATTLARAYSGKKDYFNAKRVIDLVVKNPKYNTSDFYIAFALKNAAVFYKLNGNFEEAADLYAQYIQSSDSIQKSNSLKNIDSQDLKYALETEELKFNYEQVNKDAMYQKDRQKQIIIRNSLIAGAILFILLIIVLFRSNKQKNRDNEVLITQRNELDNQQREILSSITYAKRIQTAILPPNRLLTEYLQDYFILYKPKDIVAGDFYWLEKQNDITFLAAADCTGHGVPGAMVSVICHNGLNRSLREFGISDPGNILNQTREIVIKEFEKSDDVVKDGMDISLCAFEKGTLKWAGANNPLWIIRDNEIIEFKPDKQPIGQYVNHKGFNTHTFDLKDNDILYLFTDGFKDQFGGVNEKKFKALQFKQLLLKIKDLPMELQKIKLNETFEIWKGQNEQVDDVCVIGVRYFSNQFN